MKLRPHQKLAMSIVLWSGIHPDRCRRQHTSNPPNSHSNISFTVPRFRTRLFLFVLKVKYRSTHLLLSRLLSKYSIIFFKAIPPHWRSPIEALIHRYGPFSTRSLPCSALTPLSMLLTASHRLFLWPSLFTPSIYFAVLRPSRHHIIRL